MRGLLAYWSPKNGKSIMSRAVSVDLELDNELRLQTLAEEANASHRLAESNAKTALEHARDAGLWLTEAKSRCKHGEWLKWLEENFEGTRLNAWRYMRISDKWEEISNVSQPEHLGVRKALELLSEPRETEEAEVEPLEVTPSPEVLLRRVEAFREPRITALFKAHEITVENAVLLGHIKNRGMSETLAALLEHGSDEAKVRQSKAQLEHLLKQNEHGQTDAQTAVLVERVENGETSSVFEVHRVRQEERRVETRQRSTFDNLGQSDQQLIERLESSFLSGFGGEKSREDLSRHALRFAENHDEWGDLSLEQKTELMMEKLGQKQAKRYEKTPVKDKPVQLLSDAEVQSLEVACSNLIALAHSTKALSSGDKGEVRKSLEQVNAVAERMLS